MAQHKKKQRKLNAKRLDTLIGYLGAGMTIDRAARMVGVHRNTVLETCKADPLVMEKVYTALYNPQVTRLVELERIAMDSTHDMQFQALKYLVDRADRVLGGEDDGTTTLDRLERMQGIYAALLAPINTPEE